MIIRLDYYSDNDASAVIKYLTGAGPERVGEVYYHAVPERPEDAAKYFRQLGEAARRHTPRKRMDETLAHIVVAFPPGERGPRAEVLTRNLLAEIEMADRPALAVRHVDTPHDHVHLLVTLVGHDLSVRRLWDDTFERLKTLRETPEKLWRETPAAFSLLPERNTEATRKERDRAAPSDIVDRLLRAAQRKGRQLWNQKAQNYMAERGISEGTAARLGLGYVPEKGFFARRLQKTGGVWLDAACSVRLVNKSKRRSGQYYDTLRDRILLPFFGSSGNLLGFAGRAIRPDRSPRYLNTELPRRMAFFGLPVAIAEALRSGKSPQEAGLPTRIYLVEGQFDALAIHEAGHFALSAGSSSLSLEQAQILVKWGVREVVLVPDRDEAGRRGAQETASRLALVGIRTMHVELPQGYKDVADLLAAEGAVACRNVLQQARPFEVQHREVQAQRDILKARQQTAFTRTQPGLSEDPRTACTGGRRPLSEISLYEVISRYTELKPTREGQWTGLCPIHKESNPSFSVTRGRGFHCFACGAGGKSPITFIMQVEKVSKKQALAILEERFGLQPSTTPPSSRSDKNRTGKRLLPLKNDASRRVAKESTNEVIL